MYSLKKFITPFLLITGFIIISFFAGCGGKKMPEDRSIGNNSYSLVNQDSSKVVFPNDFKGKIVVMSFIYTNCPDICPLTTHNLQMIQSKVEEEGIRNVQFLELTFDPQRDIPSVLKEYGDIRSVDYSNFQFLTGQKSVIDNLLRRMDVIALPSDTTVTETGKQIYFFTHTDRITLLDQQGNIRNEYRGSKTDVDAIFNDIKNLGD